MVRLVTVSLGLVAVLAAVPACGEDAAVTGEEWGAVMSTVVSTRREVSSDCLVVPSPVTSLMWLHCGCVEVSKPCTDAACGFCDGTAETRTGCDSYFYPVGVFLPASCSQARRDACAAFCAASASCHRGCELR